MVAPPATAGDQFSLFSAKFLFYQENASIKGTATADREIDRDFDRALANISANIGRNKIKFTYSCSPNIFLSNDTKIIEIG